MGYEKTTIKKIVNQISKGQVYLPAIQRRFVWEVEQIERLFDSIMLKYPIGTFLFWKVNSEAVNSYVFYKFIQEFHERDSLNERAPKPVFDPIIGVLDGQQRLTSLFLALQGTYAYKKPRARWADNEAFPKRKLYFNLLKNEIDPESGMTYEFKFLTVSEPILNDEKHFWFLVSDALCWENSPDYMPYAQKNNLISNTTAMQNLQLLWQCLVNDEIINFYEVENQELDDILDIFIRVNSGGTPLSKSDLLFSTIVANWEDARENIDDLLKNINSIGEGFNFNNDFIMRLCLTLMDCQIKFKVINFNKENVQNIKLQWNSIEASLKKAVRLLNEFGFSKETLTTSNIVIPIVYFIYKEGSLDAISKDGIWKYLLYGMLNQVFGSSGDSVITTIREVLREKVEIDGNICYKLSSKQFDINIFKNLRIGNEYKFRFTEETIESLLEEKKGAYTFMLLSLLCPTTRAQTSFHQDHIHPTALFNKSLKVSLNIDDAMWNNIINEKDMLANLQLLEGKENLEKNGTPFIDWFKKNVDNKGEDYKDKYLRINFIPNTSFEINNFQNFYTERNELLKKRLKELLL